MYQGYSDLLRRNIRKLCTSNLSVPVWYATDWEIKIYCLELHVINLSVPGILGDDVREGKKNNKISRV
jgi:hypothetical protein